MSTLNKVQMKRLLGKFATDVECNERYIQFTDSEKGFIYNLIYAKLNGLSAESVELVGKEVEIQLLKRQLKVVSDGLDKLLL